MPQTPAAACYKETTRFGNSCHSTTGSTVSDKSCALCHYSSYMLSGVGSTSGRIQALRRSESVVAAVVVVMEVIITVFADILA